MVRAWTVASATMAGAGMYHLALTAFDDLVEPSFFRPVSNAALRGLQHSAVAIALEAGDRTLAWDWSLGVNYAFGLGLVYFGLSTYKLEAPIRATPGMPLLVLATSGGLTCISARYLFRWPLLTSALASCCYASALLFDRAVDLADDEA